MRSGASWRGQMMSCECEDGRERSTTPRFLKSGQDAARVVGRTLSPRHRLLEAATGGASARSKSERGAADARAGRDLQMSVHSSVGFLSKD